MPACRRAQGTRSLSDVRRLAFAAARNGACCAFQPPVQGIVPSQQLPLRSIVCSILTPSIADKDSR